MPDLPDARRLSPVAATAHALVEDPRAVGASVLAMPASDSKIVEGLRSGEEWAADALYERVHDVVTQTLRRVLGPGDQELTDVVQEVFERLIVSLSEARLDEAGKLRAWAAAVATHIGVDLLRSRARRRRLFSFHDGWAENLSGGGPSLERRLEARAEMERVRGVLSRMPASRVETLILHDVLGHSLEEIATLTHVSGAAAQSRLVRGRKELERRLNLERTSGGSR